MSAGIYVGVSSIESSAILQADATDRGALVPRMTTTQRAAIASPATGLLIYNTTTGVFNWYTGAAWVALGGSSGGAPADATYITQTANGDLSAEQALSSLATGLMQVTTTTGVVSSVTTSAGLAALISDETGSGALVFGTSPTIITPTIASFLNANHTHTDAASGGLLAYSRAIFSQTASVTVANTTSATTLVGAGAGSLTIPANGLIAGAWLEIDAWGVLSSLGASPGNIRLALNFGGVSVAQTAAATLPTSLSNASWWGRFIVTVRTIGGTGTVFVHGFLVINTSTTAIQMRFEGNTSTNTIDTTTSNAVDIRVQFSVNDPANTITLTNLTVVQGAA